MRFINTDRSGSLQLGTLSDTVKKFLQMVVNNILVPNIINCSCFHLPFSNKITTVEIFKLFCFFPFCLDDYALTLNTFYLTFWWKDFYGFFIRNEKVLSLPLFVFFPNNLSDVKKHSRVLLVRCIYGQKPLADVSSSAELFSDLLLHSFYRCSSQCCVQAGAIKQAQHKLP